MTTAFDYAGARDTADALLAEFGQAVTIRRITSGGSPFAPTQTTTDYATTAAILTLTRWYPPLIPATDILRTDRRGVIAAGPLAALGIVVQKFDKLLLADGTVFSILDVKPVYPAGLSVLFDTWLRV